MRICLVSLLLSLIHVTLYAQSDTVQLRVVLIGDAGSLVNGRAPVVDAARKRVTFDGKTVVIYLGDNIYPQGLPDYQAADFRQYANILDSQAAIGDGNKSQVFFIPGNHDWENGSPTGWDAIRRQQQYIDGLGKSNVRFLPKDGCPGPIEVQLSNDVTLVIMDSEWWLTANDKPGIEYDCDTKTESEVLTQLQDILARNSKKLVLFACHHPFKSYGIHGGYFTIKQHIFPLTDMWKTAYIPLPVIGSIYPITRGIFGTAEDMPHPAYQHMIHEVEKVAKSHPNLIFVSGHEHGLQLIRDSNYTYIVSGGGCKSTRVSKTSKTDYAAEQMGFATLEVSNNKNVKVDFYEVKDSVHLGHSANVLNFSTINIAQLPKKDSAAVVSIDYGRRAKVAANLWYDSASGLKRFLLGENYRKEWATPVEVPIFNLNKEKGGFIIKSLGGGKETKSLRLQDKYGKEWVLRTLKKDPEKIVPENFRNSVAEELVQDFISGSHPYAPLIVPPLANAIGVVEANPEMYYVPDDPAFGFYRPIFANTLVYLEAHDPVPDTSSNTKSTPKVINKMIEDNDNRVDQEAVLRARLLDILIGDYDRHFDQWQFGVLDTGKGKLYYPIPRDRDKAFFLDNGFILNHMVQRLFPYLTGFRANIPNVKYMGYTSKDFDRIFMTKLDDNDWKRITAYVQQHITDNVIDSAVRRLPAAVFAEDGGVLQSKLKSRRDKLMKASMTYYSFLNKYVDVIGSNQPEYFKVSGDGDKLSVKVYKRKGMNDMAALMYERNFDKKVTQEVRLYGLNGNDIFDVDESAARGIKLRMIGGRGDDTFNVRGNVRSYLYDLNTEKNFISGSSHVINKFSASPGVNNYDITDFRYNRLQFPKINLGYNAEDGVMLGLGLQNTHYGFRKYPASVQKLSTLYSPSTSAFRVNYMGEFNKVVASNDVVINATLVNPVLNNFFGLGNVTRIDPSRGIEFYRVRYNYLQADVALRKTMFTYFHFTVGPTFHYYWNNPADNAGKILSRPSLVGLDSSSVYAKNAYLGAKVGMLINNLDNELFPRRGIDWNTELSSMANINGNNKPVTKLISNMTVYGSVTNPATFIGIFKIGGGKIFSKDYPYYMALDLGQNNFLRGFRKNRFAGTSMAYSSFELRYKLGNSKSYILPGDFGLIGFADVGRVWFENENSRKWHFAKGGGVYFAPFNAVLFTATVAFSPEETLANFSVGTRYNLTF
ncbi:MAG: metallophosphoesterase [Chitinophagaceae bacterium]|nr:metallophosphoesterase [Chitinophagaceae bacterium]